MYTLKNWVEAQFFVKLASVLSSGLPARNAFSIADAGGFEHDDYIKSYLLSQSDMTFPTAIKIILPSSITPELIVQLTDFKNHLKTVDFCLFQEVFGEIHKTRKY